MPLSDPTSPDKSQGLGCSPDVNKLGIANIAINTTPMEPNLSQKTTANVAAFANVAVKCLEGGVEHFAMISSTNS